MSCVHSYIQTTYSKVCELCGSECPFVENCSFENVGFNSNHNQRFAEGYRRIIRFKKILRQILTASLSPLDNKMVQYLQKNREDFCDLKTLTETMKKAPNKDKRFNSIHAFSRVFLNKCVKIDNVLVDRIVHVFCKEFELFETRFALHHTGKAFINLKFLLHYLFEKHNLTSMSEFVPKLKCSKRYKFYTKLMTQLETAVQVSVK